MTAPEGMPASVTPWLSPDGALVAARIELEEASGSVAPAYQFDTHVRISATAKSKDSSDVELMVDHRAGLDKEPPSKVVKHTGPLSRDAYETLWRDLVAAGVLTLDHKLDEKTLSKTGASFNTLEIEVGTTKIHFEYTLTQLKRPEMASASAVIERVKKAAGV